MAKSGKLPPTPTWASTYGEPQGARLDELRAASTWSTRLLQHDGGQDVLVLPLELGLAALDVIQAPIADGHSLIADYLHGKLMAFVPSGWAQLWEFVREVRVVSQGGWVLVPAYGQLGSFAASWLSQPPPRLASSWEDQVAAEQGEDSECAGFPPDSLRALVTAGSLDPQQLYEALADRRSEVAS